jgi:NADPH:quinone reductase-like Zn-dependent oxidoreductase
MKAIGLLEYGGQLVFNAVPAPMIARDEVLAKIKSTAVNRGGSLAAGSTA